MRVGVKVVKGSPVRWAGIWEEEQAMQGAWALGWEPVLEWARKGHRGAGIMRPVIKFHHHLQLVTSLLCASVSPAVKWVIVGPTSLGCHEGYVSY